MTADKGVRRVSRVVKIGNIYIGGSNPVAIQSMTKVKAEDVAKTVSQIKELEKSGCEIIRVAVKDRADARALKKIKPQIGIPLVADIHFDWRLALEAIACGADKIRLNPGNIHKKEQVRQIVKEAGLKGIPIRVGMNSGSLRTASSKVRPGGQAADIMVKSALEYLKILEGLNFFDIVVSLKASNIADTIRAYRLMSQLRDYPLHLGVTATGSPYSGAIKSGIAIGALLLEGIGDTIRVSLTDKPVQEVEAAKAILEAVGLRRFKPEIISCPTCGRCEVDLVKIVKDLERQLSAARSDLPTRPMRLAVMGCVVNGPGEAASADIGIAFGRKEGLLFKGGKTIRKVKPSECVKAILKECKIDG